VSEQEAKFLLRVSEIKLLIKIHWSFLRYDMEMMNGAGQTLNVIAVSNRFKSLLIGMPATAGESCLATKK
jgi:hypothetical protein